MSNCTRLPRKATEAARYTFDAADDSADEVDEHETDEDDDEAMRARRKKPAAKRRKVEGKRVAEYDIPRVDFSTRLPVELVNEILSYLGPSSLFALSTLSKTLYALLTHESTRQLWLNALDVEKLPKQGDKEIKPTKLCALVLGKKCQFCNKNDAVPPDAYLAVRSCIECRHANWVLIGDVGPGKKYDDFHPATLQCAFVTDYAPQNPHYSRATVKYVCWSQLHAIHEQLEELQLLDDLEKDKPFDETGPDAAAARKNFAQARRTVGFSRRGAVDKDLTSVESSMAAQWSPRVKKFVEDRRALLTDRNKLVDWIKKHRDDLIADRDSEFRDSLQFVREAAERNRHHLEERVLDDGVFKKGHFNKLEWRENSLVKDCGVVTDEIWESLKTPLYRLLGKISAEAIYKRSKKRVDDSDDESGRPRLPKKPQSVSKQAWKYILPELRKVAKARRRDEADDVNQVKPVAAPPKRAPTPAKTPEPMLPWDQRLTQNDFLRDWHGKIDAQQKHDENERFLKYRDFCDLPTVRQLRAHALLGIDAAARDKDNVKFEAEIDSILAEAAELILERTLQEIAALDSSVLLPNEDGDEDEDDSPIYGDAFFRRPSSWVCCADCGGFGPLDALLNSKQQHHRYWCSSSKVDLPLEVACAWSAVLELLQLDPDDEDVTPATVDKAMSGHVLRWENAPDHKPGKHNWKKLIVKVRKTARAFDRKNVALPAPVIELKKYKRRPFNYSYFYGW
ncbi:hypothetical protein JCM8097_001901 [Rhodosporidiobolus ruineniae]